MAGRRNGRFRGGPPVLLSAVAALGLAACGGDEEASVDVTLQEFSVTPAEESVPAGSITFQVENTGPDDVHEFVVIKTDLDPADLPTDENGAVDEEGDGVEVLDEIEDVEVGDTRSVTVDLDAGSYALICNVWDEEEQEAHYKLGMRAPFTVT